MSEIRYRAFLSYSHRDREVADWLHHELETFRVPARMVGEETKLGPVPARLHPIFKDREELSASGSLGEAITTALERSTALIVVCSPASAASPWVNEEVRTFKAMHGPAHVFAVIAAGEPGHADNECFPPALRFTLDEAGKVTDKPAEPIAADLRPEGDGRRLGKLKIIAGLLGVGLDELVQRDAARRQRRLRYLVAAALAGMAVTSGLAISAVLARDEARDQRNEAQRQRIEADGLVEFMLTDLRKKLEPVGKLDVLDTVGRRALVYYSHQKPSELDADALGRRARALQLVAEVRNLRGDSEGALAAFRQTAATTQELLARHPNDGQRIFDHAQSVFWVGQIAWQRGDTAAGIGNLKEYSRRLTEGGYDINARWLTCRLAEGLANNQHAEQAWRLLNDFDPDPDRRSDVYVPEFLRVRGVVLAEAGEATAAAQALHASLEMADAQGALSWRLRTISSLARLRLKQGRLSEAREMLADTYGRFTEGFETLDLRTARTLITEIDARTGASTPT